MRTTSKRKNLKSPDKQNVLNFTEETDKKLKCYLMKSVI